MALDDVFRLTAQFNMPEGTIQQLVWHYIQTTVGAASNQAFLDAVETMLTAAWADIEDSIADTVVGDTLALALYDPVGGEFGTRLTNDISALVGTNAVHDMLPHQDAAVVLFYTQVAKSIGKKFISGLVEDIQADSVIDAGIIVDLLLFAAEMQDDLVGGPNTYSPGNFNLLAAIFRPWSDTVGVNVLLGSMDSRRPGIGI